MDTKYILLQDLLEELVQQTYLYEMALKDNSTLAERKLIRIQIRSIQLKIGLIKQVDGNQSPLFTQPYD